MSDLIDRLILDGESLHDLSPAELLKLYRDEEHTAEMFKVIEAEVILRVHGAPQIA